MRVMARISIPVEAGNRAAKDGSLVRVIQETVDTWKPESTYLTTFDGRRTAFLVFPMTTHRSTMS